MTLDELPTPAVLVEKSALEANIASMQARAEANRVAIRPHVKTHRSPSVGRMQIDAGASGVTVAKVGEAEVFAKAGFKDIRLAYCVVGTNKYRRIAELDERVRISFCVDTEVGATLASDFFASRGRTLNVLIEVDTGQHRCGVAWEDDEVVLLAERIEELKGLQYVGILTHGGYGYYGPRGDETKEQALRRWSIQERDRMLDVASRLKHEGFAPGEISIGSTPTMRYFENRVVDGQTITEIRPGNYVFNDLTQVGLGVASLSDCAQTVLATVVSRHRDRDGSERFFLDAGKKVLTSDGAFGQDGFGALLYNARTMVSLPHATISNLSEEHAWASVRGGTTVAVGDRLRIVPNHACVVANMQPKMYLVDGDDVLEELPVDAQSQST
jgi:D-serine deaminase-like pyridoxal phosphate-dependent protein